MRRVVACPARRSRAGGGVALRLVLPLPGCEPKGIVRGSRLVCKYPLRTCHEVAETSPAYDVDKGRWVLFVCNRKTPVRLDAVVEVLC